MYTLLRLSLLLRRLLLYGHSISRNPFFILFSFFLFWHTNTFLAEKLYMSWSLINGLIRLLADYI
jgi:hypothetical protein